VQQFEISLSATESGVQKNQRSKAGAINGAYLFQIEDLALIPFLNGRFDRILEGGELRPQDNTAGEIEDEDTVDFAGMQFDASFSSPI